MEPNKSISSALYDFFELHFDSSVMNVILLFSQVSFIWSRSYFDGSWKQENYIVLYFSSQYITADFSLFKWMGTNKSIENEVEISGPLYKGPFMKCHWQLQMKMFFIQREIFPWCVDQAFSFGYLKNVHYSYEWLCCSISQLIV